MSRYTIQRLTENGLVSIHDTVVKWDQMASDLSDMIAACESQLWRARDALPVFTALCTARAVVRDVDGSTVVDAERDICTTRP